MSKCDKCGKEIKEKDDPWKLFNKSLCYECWLKYIIERNPIETYKEREERLEKLGGESKP